ncbi:MAG: hypothetical protein IPH72_24110 [Sandaracinaceae bacterium]|nr:hypothetical protein [Sandaracinaceae bacterium]
MSTRRRRAPSAPVLLAFVAALSPLAAGCGDSSSTGMDGGGVDGGGRDSGPIVPPPATCTPPITLVDTSTPDRVVGDGTPASCTHANLAAAVAQGGVITFDCGAGEHTIAIPTALDLRIDTDTIIDGGGTITLSGGDASRIFEYDSRTTA